jgi:hypothetical protein
LQKKIYKNKLYLTIYKLYLGCYYYVVNKIYIINKVKGEIEMKEIKKYMDVVRYGKSSTNGVIQEGDTISITEKIDGANSSFRLDEENPLGLSCYSRNNPLDEHNTLSGFYNWVVENVLPIKDKLNPNYIYYGEWLCLSGDTIIKKTSGGKKQGNYMTLRDMYKYSITPIKEKQKYKLKNGSTEEHDYELRSQWEKEGYPQIWSLDIKEDKLRPNRILKIISSGNKEVYEIITRKGKTIKSTLEHRFWTNNGWKQLKDIKVGDVVGVTDLLSQRKPRRFGKGSRQLKQEMDEYKKKVGKCESCGNTTCLELHHKDQNFLNNDKSNWEILCKDCHNTQHSNFGMVSEKQLYNYEFDKIVSIEYVGIEDCYDICMEGGENEASFVGNGFIVHNCKHKVIYKDECYRNFYMFSVWDIEKEQYLSDEVVISEAERLGLKTTNYFYVGKYISFEHLMSFVGKSDMTLEPNTGEGVVVKNVNYVDKYGNQMFVKLVSERFAEVQKQKLPKNPNVTDKVTELIRSVLTKPRVEKIMYKLVDEDLLKSDYAIEDMGIILKALGSRVYEDIMKEESDLFVKYEEDKIKRTIGKNIPSVVKEVLKEQGRI